MTAEDTARALMAMSDIETRRAVARGDLAPLAEFELTKEEHRLLFHAARDDVAADADVQTEDDDEVVVFGGDAVPFAPPYVPVGPVVSGMVAIRYVEDHLSPDSPIRSQFSGFATTFANGSW